MIRSQFDHILLQHARTPAVRVLERTSLRRVTFTADRATAASWSSPDHHDAQVTFRCLVDASGGAGVLAARQLRTRRLHDIFRNVATWGYWSGATPLHDAPEGATGVFSLPDNGWLWAIPLHDGTLRVGLVTDKRSFNRARNEHGSIDAVYHAALRKAPLLHRILHHAKPLTPRSPAQAAAGLYLSLDPQLGLRRTT